MVLHADRRARGHQVRERAVHVAVQVGRELAVLRTVLLTQALGEEAGGEAGNRDRALLEPIRLVDAGDRVEVQPVRRPPVGADAADEAAQLLLVPPPADVVRSVREAEATAARDVAGRRIGLREGVEQRARARVAFVWQLDVAGDEVGARADAELVVDEARQVRAQVGALEVVRLRRARPLLGLARDEEGRAGLARAAGNAQAQLVDVAFAQRRAGSIEQRVVAVQRVHRRAHARRSLDQAAVADGVEVGAEAACADVVGNEAVGHVHHRALGVRADLRAPSAAALRRDLDHAVRRGGAIKRRSRRPLQHLDRRDVLRIDVVPPRRRDATGEEAARLDLVADADAIDQDERRALERDARVAADPDA